MKFHLYFDVWPHFKDIMKCQLYLLYIGPHFKGMMKSWNKWNISFVFCYMHDLVLRVQWNVSCICCTLDPILRVWWNFNCIFLYARFKGTMKHHLYFLVYWTAKIGIFRLSCHSFFRPFSKQILDSAIKYWGSSWLGFTSLVGQQKLKTMSAHLNNLLQHLCTGFLNSFSSVISSNWKQRKL